MGGAALRAHHSHYSERGLSIWEADVSDIVAVDMHTGRTSAGTGQLVNLEGIDDFIVFFLRNRIV